MWSPTRSAKSAVTVLRVASEGAAGAAGAGGAVADVGVPHSSQNLAVGRSSALQDGAPPGQRRAAFTAEARPVPVRLAALPAIHCPVTPILPMFRPDRTGG